MLGELLEMRKAEKSIISGRISARATPPFIFFLAPLRKLRDSASLEDILARQNAALPA